MGDAAFEDVRLAAIYDALDPDRSDLDAYVAIVVVEEVRDASDRPGREFVFIARRPEHVAEVDQTS